MSNSNLAPSTSYAFRVGAAGDRPVAGDWDGDGADSVGLYRSGTWLLRNSNSSGAPDLRVAFGTSSDLPVVGDWDADGRVSIGYFRAGGWYLSNRIAAPSVDVHASYGSSTDTPVVGNWGPRTQRFGDPPASLTSFYPIAVDFQPPSSFGTWKSRGINTAIRVPSGTDIEAWTSAANAHGLKMIRRARADPARDDAEANLLAFAGLDEPELNGCSPGCVEADYRRLKQSAPSKPYLVNLAGTSVLFRGGTTDPYECNRDCITRYLGAMDWVSHDIYAVNSHLPIDSIGRTLERLHRWSARRPQFAYIEASDFNNDGIRPTRDQFRAQIWDAIIHGARGISYFAVDAARPIERPDAVPADIAAEMQLQNSRITELAGVLQSTINPAAIGVQAKPPRSSTAGAASVPAPTSSCSTSPPRRSTTRPSKSSGRPCRRRSPSGTRAGRSRRRKHLHRFVRSVRGSRVSVPITEPVDDDRVLLRLVSASASGPPVRSFFAAHAS